MNNHLQQLQDNIINLLRNDRGFISHRPQNFSEDVEQFFNMFYNGDVMERTNTELDIRRAIEVNYNDMQDFYNARIANARNGESNVGIDENIWGDIADYVDSLVLNQPVQNNIPQILQQPLLQHVPQINIGNIQQQNAFPGLTQDILDELRFNEEHSEIRNRYNMLMEMRDEDGSVNSAELDLINEGHDRHGQWLAALAENQQHVPQLNIGNIQQQQNIVPQVQNNIQQTQPIAHRTRLQTQPIASRTRTQDGTIKRIDHSRM